MRPLHELIVRAAEDGEIARRYEEINAKTMYNMMEEIGNQRLFFLTNRLVCLNDAEIMLSVLQIIFSSY